MLVLDASTKQLSYRGLRETGAEAGFRESRPAGNVTRRLLPRGPGLGVSAQRGDSEGRPETRPTVSSTLPRTPAPRSMQAGTSAPCARTRVRVPGLGGERRRRDPTDPPARAAPPAFAAVVSPAKAQRHREETPRRPGRRICDKRTGPGGVRSPGSEGPGIGEANLPRPPSQPRQPLRALRACAET